MRVDRWRGGPSFESVSEDVTIVQMSLHGIDAVETLQW